MNAALEEMRRSISDGGLGDEGDRKFHASVAAASPQSDPTSVPWVSARTRAGAREGTAPCLFPPMLRTVGATLRVAPVHGHRMTTAPPPTGRPTLLTDAVTAKVAAGIRNGMFLGSAAITAGISPRSATEWLTRGTGADPERPPDRIHLEFARVVAEARAEREAIALSCVHLAPGAR